MTKLAICLIAALAASVAAQEADRELQGAPWFCHGLDCPPFKVVNSTNIYEIRTLEKGAWAATRVESLLYSVGVSEGFRKLFKYISGDNEEETKIAMTAPVVTRVVPGDGPFCKSTFSVHFYVPFKYQDKPPKPSNPDVSIEHAKKETFAVLQFGGFLVDDFTLSSKAKALQEALDTEGIAYESESYFAASYDPPTRLQHRHNEIWVRLPASRAESLFEKAATA